MWLLETIVHRDSGGIQSLGLRLAAAPATLVIKGPRPQSADDLLRD